MIIDHLPADSAYHRTRSPEDAPWARLEAQMLAVVANMMSEIRWLLALDRFEDVPAELGPVAYGPPRQQNDVNDNDSEDNEILDDVSALDRARAAAADILG